MTGMDGKVAQAGKGTRNIKCFMCVLLLPFSWLYELATRIRNHMFDTGMLKSQKFTVPTICVGNITVGGTGKTPHVEYLAELLGRVCCTGVVSRGYRRKTKGLVVADSNTTADEIGDEPFQIKKHFPTVHIAVCARRATAIERLLAPDIKPPVDVVLLDDAFQHRYVAAGLNIVLVDYNRPV